MLGARSSHLVQVASHVLLSNDLLAVMVFEDLGARVLRSVVGFSSLMQNSIEGRYGY